MGLTDTSKFLSLILRHKPDTIGISLDEHGWANVSELIEGIQRQGRLTWKCSKKLYKQIINKDIHLMKIRRS